MGYPRVPLLLLILQAHLCLVSPGVAGLSFSYDFSIPDPGRINRKILRYISQPVRLWDGLTGKRASFSTSFSFSMSGLRVGLNTTTLPKGPGTAFFIGPFPSSLPPNSGGGLLGLFGDKSSFTPTVAVEFDTQWDEGWDPYDATGDHVGINVNSIHSDSYSRDLAKGDLAAGTVSANVTYDAGSNLLEVTVRLANGSTTSISALLNLKKQRLPQDAAIGFSTGKGEDTNFSPVLISWSFSSTVAKEFSYNELSASTNNFSEDRKLGAGSFGKVYRGDLKDPRMPPVAVKVLTGHMDSQIRKDFVTEVTTLCQLSHRNLVKLVGWCSDGKPLMLVYELVTNRSLDEHLHGQGRLLTWTERYQVALDIGFAIEYLHNGCKEPILHRDIKPDNVMLDDAFHAKLGDFGLVRQVNPGQGSLRGTTMIGSYHYMDPQCTNGSASTASDMYSFGVLLLEVATGKRSQASLDPEKGFPNSLTSTVRESYHKGHVVEMADARLNGDFDKSQMARVLTVGLLCVQLDRALRPEIREAINMLSNPSHPVPQLGA
uniref:non-specific serine/threonine protein kinase n=1 Tax=Setaria italica TaxID=4555 RepID=K3ZM87_SETIT